MPRLRRRVLASLAVLLGAGAAQAFAPAAPGVLQPLVRILPSVVPAEDAAKQAALQASHPGVARLVEEAGGPWEVSFDLESGRLRRAIGTGIPFIPGTANALPARGGEVSLADLERIGREFLDRHADLFAIDADEWSVSPEGSQPLDGGVIRPLVFHRSLGGVPVQYAQIQMVLNHGNLTYINATGMGPVATSPVPSLDEAASWEVVAREAAGIGISLAEATFIGRPELVLVPVQDTPGGPTRHRLLRYHTFRLPAGVETWHAGVDAQTGDLVELEDVNRYACSLDPTKVQGQVRGGVRAAQATDPEQTLNFIFPLVDNNGPVDGDSNGYYFYGGGAASSNLQGRYFKVNCVGCNPNPPFVSSQTDAILDFGTGGVNNTSNLKSTPADRTSYYHLNYARAIAAKWMDRDWIRSNVQDNVNIAQTCNAFWDSTAVNFFRSGGGCANTGEIRDVMQHEWGHGLDSNDGQAPSDRAMGEAYGDYIALFVDHDSCIGQSFFGQSSGPYCKDVPGCGTTADCTGVRNTDEKRSTRGPITINNVSSKCSSGSCPGALGFECHCEGEIFGQAAFHLSMNLLNGFDYDTNAPFGAGNPKLSDVAAWFVHEHLFFNAAQLMKSYAPSNKQGVGMGAYDAFTVVDDDDGNPTNGVPHAAYINPAFQHHNMEEPTVRADSPNCVPGGDPVFTLTPLLDSTSGNAQIKVSFPDQPNTAFYIVYRSLRPSDAWLPIRSSIPDDNRPVYDIYDEPVQIGMTYYYTAIAVNELGPNRVPCPSPGAGVKSVVVAVPDISASVGQIQDPAPGGDNDGIPEPGEKVKIRVDVREVAGLVALNNASVTLSSLDPLAVVTVGGPISYGTVPPATTVNGPSTFEVAISSSHPCGSFVSLLASVSGDNGCLLRALSLSIPSASCVPAPRGEASPVSMTMTGDSLNSGCKDGDGILDNGEIASLDVGIKNNGNATATGITVNLVAQNPRVTVVGTNPATIPSLGAGASQTVTFQITAAGASCMETATLQATANSNENLFPIARTLTITLEEDRQALSLSTGFEGGFAPWVPNGFSQDGRRAAAGAAAAFAGPPAGSTPTCPTGGSAGADGCATLTSPKFVASANSAFQLSTWYQLEVFTPNPAQFWDRANVHVIDDAGVHTMITPTAGRAYDGSQGQSTGLCHINPENGWAGCGGNSWATSTFNLAAWAGKEIQLEVNYNADGADISEGIYLDEVSVTNAFKRVCDALSCVALPSVDVATCTAADLCVASGGSDGVLDPGDEVTYSLTLRNNGQGPADDVQGTVAVTGGTIVSGGTIGGTPRIDIPAGGNHVHTVVVRVTASCGTALNVDVNNLRAGANVFTPNQAVCDRSIGASQAGSTLVLRDAANLPIPELPAPALGRNLASSAAAVTRATIALDVTHSRPSEIVALLVGPRGGTVVVNGALGGTLDVTGFVNSQGAGNYSLSIQDNIPGRRGTLVEWSLTLEVPASSQCNACAAGSCAAPGVAVQVSNPQPCPGVAVSFSATMNPPGSGSFDYEWDFGDGTPPVTVTNPFAAAVHDFALVPGNYTVMLRAKSRQQPSCDAVGSTPIAVSAGTVPTGGPVGNRLRVVRVGQVGARLEWPGSGVTPPLYNLHKALDKAELVDTLAGIGNEAILVRTSQESAADAAALLAGPSVAYYEVFASTSCGTSVLVP